MRIQKQTPKKERAEHLLSRACAQWDCGKLRSAFSLMVSAAKLGDCAAQLDLGYFYDYGLGVKRNREMAMHWYRRAWRNGLSSGANNIGTIFRDQGQPRRALGWFLKAVAKGDPDANLEIAKLYVREGWGNAKASQHLIRVIKTRPQTVTEHSREQDGVQPKTNEQPHRNPEDRHRHARRGCHCQRGQ
jgi:TPR repeat protein